MRLQQKDKIDRLVYNPSTTELCVKAVSEDLVEPALMMVVPMLARIIRATNVHYDITRGEDTRVSRPDKPCRARSTDPPTWTKQPRTKGREVKVCIERKNRNLRCTSSLYRSGESRTRVLKRRGFAKQVDRKGFVTMESTVMGTNQGFCSPV